MVLSDRVYRIANSKHADDISGMGAFLYGGRWNNEGIRMLYTSENSSLSILEVLVYTSSKTFAKKEIIEIDFPKNSIMEIPIEKLKKGWDCIPAGDYTKNIGDNWAKSNQSLVLIVPSAINPRERNVLINPLHPEFEELKIVSKESFSFDRRLFFKEKR